MGLGLVLILAILSGLVWLGRQTRKAGYRPRPLFKQGRAISGIVAVALGLTGMVCLVRGLSAVGSVFIAVAVALMSGLKLNMRLSGRHVPELHPDAKTLDALSLLGLKPGAGREAIDQAWREAMKRAHPDAGGSPSEAARYNAARDWLLKSLDQNHTDKKA